MKNTDYQPLPPAGGKPIRVRAVIPGRRVVLFLPPGTRRVLLTLRVLRTPLAPGRRAFPGVPNPNPETNPHLNN